MDKLFEWEIIKSRDIVVIKNIDNSGETVINAKYVNSKGKKLHSINVDERLLDGLQLEFILGLYLNVAIRLYIK